MHYTCTFLSLSNSDRDGILTIRLMYTVRCAQTFFDEKHNYVYAFARAGYDSIAAAVVGTHWETFFYLYNY